MNKGSIDFNNFSYYYTGKKIPSLSSLNLSFGRNELIEITGGTGSGKSTFCKALAGIVPHHYGGRVSGRVYINGNDTRRLKPEELYPEVSMVFQDPELQILMRRPEQELSASIERYRQGMWFDSIFESVAPGKNYLYEKKIFDINSDDYAGSALKLMKIFSIPEFMTSVLSSGEKQLLSFLNVIIPSPEIIIMDEPFSQLDERNLKSMIEILRRIKGKVTLIIAHHMKKYIFQDSRKIHIEGGVITYDSINDGALKSDDNIYAPSLINHANSGTINCPSIEKNSAINLENGKNEGIFLEGQSKKDALLEIDSVSFSFSKGGSKNSGNNLSNNCSNTVSNNLIDGLSLVVAAGRTIGIVGKNGAGKTTLARIICGVYHQLSGRILYGGNELKKANISGFCGLVSQNPGDILFMDTVLDEIMFTAGLYNVPEHDAIEVTASLDINPLLNKAPWELSSGEKEMAAIAAVSAGRQKLLILDEPTRGLDMGKKQAIASMLSWRNSKGFSNIVISHDIEFIRSVCHEVYSLNEGRLFRMEAD